MPMFPSVDESRDRLHRAGWSVGEVAGIGGWPELRSNGEVSLRTRRIGLVSGTNGENRVNAMAASQAEAWSIACQQALAVGMLAPARGEGLRAWARPFPWRAGLPRGRMAPTAGGCPAGAQRPWRGKEVQMEVVEVLAAWPGADLKPRPDSS
jgi:hypothetical protein